MFVPLIDKKLDVANETQEDKEKVTNEPIKETKTVQVQLTNEKKWLLKQDLKADTNAKGPLSSPHDIEIPPKKEEIDKVKKQPCFKEDVVVTVSPVVGILLSCVSYNFSIIKFENILLL